MKRKPFKPSMGSNPIKANIIQLGQLKSWQAIPLPNIPEDSDLEDWEWDWNGDNL